MTDKMKRMAEVVALRMAAERVAYGINWKRREKIPHEGMKIQPKGTDLVFFVSPFQRNRGGTEWRVEGYYGKAQKPFVNDLFRNERDVEKYIGEQIEWRKRHLKDKADRQQEIRDFKHSFKLGDVLYTSWGYDQTNVDFYLVVDFKGSKSIVVRPIGSKVKSGDGMSQLVVPDVNRFVGPPVTKTPRGGDHVTIDRQHASKWGGKPVYESGPYGGH